MLTVGVDTYITLDDANDFVSKYYVSTDVLRTKWESLSVDDRETLLRMSTDALDRLKYSVGRKKNNQKLQFPRIANYGMFGVTWLPYTSQFFDSGLITNNGPHGDSDGMLAIGKATIVNALYASLVDDDIKERRKNDIVGITSKKMGNISKNFTSSYNYDSELAKNGIYTKEVFSILVDWKPSSIGTI